MNRIIKQVIAMLVVAAAIIGSVALVSVAYSRVRYDPNLEETRVVSYEYVNLREKPWGNIKTELTKFTKVNLTGCYREYLWADENALWYEVVTEHGDRGWIVFEAVREIPVWEY